MIAYGKILLKPYIKCIVLVLFATMFGVFAYSTAQLEQYFDFTEILPSDSYILGWWKTSASSELGTGIRSVYQGDSYLSPAIAKLLVEDRQLGNATSNKGNSYHQLTNREKEILKLTAEGHTVREIADKLIISPKTVEGHKTNMMSKLNLHSTAELIKYALRNGIITV